MYRWLFNITIIIIKQYQSLTLSIFTVEEPISLRNSMLIFNRSQSLMRVNNKKVLFDVRSSIETLRTPQLGLEPSFILTGYSSGLT